VEGPFRGGPRAPGDPGAAHWWDPLAAIPARRRHAQFHPGSRRGELIRGGGLRTFTATFERSPALRPPAPDD